MAISTAPDPNFLPDDEDVMGPLLRGPQAGPFPPPVQADLQGGPVAPPLLSPPPATPPVVPPGMIDAPAAAPMTGPGTGYEDALSKLGQMYGQYPQMSKPKWWQNVLGGVAGGLAGWSNAASRTRQPIDIGAMGENILHPGYRQKIEEWQSRVVPLQQQAQIEGAKQQAWWKNQQLQAQAEYLKEHGAYWKHRSEMEQNQWKPVQGKPGWFYNTITMETKSIAEPGTVERQRYDTAKALNKNIPEEAAWYYALNGSLTGYAGTLQRDTPEKPLIVPAGAEYKDPETGQWHVNPREFAPQREPTEKPPGPKDFQKITATKNTALARAEASARKRIAAGEDEATVWKDLEKDKQQAQNDFEDSVNTLGGTARHYEYPSAPAASTGESQTHTGPAPRTGGGTTTPKAGAPKTAAAPKNRKPLKDIFG